MKPQNVQLERKDGSRLCCELVHNEPLPDGTDCWEIANVLYQAGDAIIVDMMPPDTQLKFSTTVDPSAIELTWGDDADE